MNTRVCFTLSVLCFLCQNFSFAQTTSDCDGGIILCDSYYSEETAPVGSGTVYEPMPVFGCNGTSGEVNSLWYIFTVQQDGELSFILNPNEANTDYDWSVFNISDNGCAGILDGTSPEVSCNSWGSFGINGPTGISTDQGGFGNSNGPGDLNGPPFNGDLPVTAGQTFALIVMNWTGSTEGYTLDFGESTASLYDDVPPSLAEVSANCANTEITITFSEGVLTNTIQESDFVINGPGGPYGVSDAAFSGEMDNTIVITLDQQIANAGTYTLEITENSQFVTDQCGNEGTGNIVFDLPAPLAFETEVTTACNGTGGTIEIQDIFGGQEPFTYAVNGSTQSQPFFDDLDDGNYNVSLIDDSGCNLSVQVTVPNQVTSVDAGVADSLSCLNPIVDIGPVVVSPDQTVTYTWSTDDGTIQSGITSSTLSVSSPGTYEVTVENTENGCTDTDVVTVYADDQFTFDLSAIVFPNVITPNPDQYNSYWAPFLPDDPEFDLTTIFSVYDLRIFNRWGNEIFHSDGSNRRWRAKEEDAGTYFYTLIYESQCGTGAREQREGYIQVLVKE
ncbi:MAG: hypothetical protein RL220_1006 [Bacteroidota bacterium]